MQLQSTAWDQKAGKIGAGRGVLVFSGTKHSMNPGTSNIERLPVVDVLGYSRLGFLLGENVTHGVGWVGYRGCDSGGNILFFGLGRYWLGYRALRSGFKILTLTGFDPPSLRFGRQAGFDGVGPGKLGLET